tara:strand:- start:347 stop:517 length:171 start_codon:yes stop_codon:yes gene_type:complete
MQRLQNPTRANARHTKLVRFWSEGKMAESAFNRMEELKENNRDQDARDILDEWIIN